MTQTQTLKTNGDLLREHADKIRMPLRTLEQVRAALEHDRKRSTKKSGRIDVAMARLMLNHGRLSDEAREYVVREYPQ